MEKFLSVGLDPTTSTQLARLRADKMINSKQYIICPALNRRKVYLTNYLMINSGDRSGAHRLQSLPAAIALIRETDKYYKTSKYRNSYELRGFVKTGEKIIAHIREESFQGKNKRLFLVSSYWTNKKSQ